jgi:hypothetical protein
MIKSWQKSLKNLSKKSKNPKMAVAKTNFNIHPITLLDNFKRGLIR